MTFFRFRSQLVATAIAFLVFNFSFVSKAQSAQEDTLKRGFIDPPSSAMPRVWWHWMNGNIAPEGIKLDLEWMHRIGIAGFTVFEGAIDTPQVVPQRLVFMTPEWKRSFNYALSTAKGFHMEIAIASSPGWSETGGPWVTPAQAMKKMVWSATRVEGGKPFHGTLVRPSDATGEFQNYQRRRDGEQTPAVLPRFYADASVVAYRIPKDDKTQAELNPSITSSGGKLNARGLSDGDIDTVALQLPAVPAGSDTGAWVQFDYGRPQTIQAITLASLDDMVSVFGFESSAPLPELQASDDGKIFRKVVDIPGSSVPQRTTSFPRVTARFFRLSFPAPEPSAAQDHRITELILTSGARVNQFEKRAGYANVQNFYAISDPAVASESTVRQDDVIDLTARMQPDGSLEWTPPTGDWMILRIGYSLTGHENGPAPIEATGLEVDKLNRNYVKTYLDSYLKMYSDAVGQSKIERSGISLMLTDSIEVGPQNWTDNMLGEFQQRRGYDPHPWLPALTGIVIGSPEKTDRFLWDFRRTIGELIAQNHYGEISEELHRRGLKYYGEALEFHRPSLGDDMEMRSKTDIPMGAMWTFSEADGPQPSYVADLRGAASVAHVYGQNLVGAESMTSAGPAWSWFPGNLKRIADLQMALGVNRFMIHESSHQPLVDSRPGLTLGIAGQFFTRNETWADEAGPWISYLGRSSYMLQQGRFVGDVAYFYGEEGPLTALFGWHLQQDAPHGYGFDFVNSDAVLHHLSFQNGRLISSGGGSYRLLYLGGRSSRMTLPVLRQIKSLVAEGAVIAGERPVDSPSLADDETELHSIVNELWGNASSTSPSVHSYGKGKVYTGKTADEVLADLSVSRDFDYSQPEPDTNLIFVHRKLTDGEIYFVDNRKDRVEDVDATFRVSGQNPELWDPATGASTAASYRIADGRTTVPLHLDPYETVFVVFHGAASAPSRQTPRSIETTVSSPSDSLDAHWTVAFQPERGAPPQAEFDRLTSWSDNANEGIRYFSGTATYTKTIDAPASWFREGAHLSIDLGDVRDIAEVAVNGKTLGVLWKSPYRIDLGDALRPGKNTVTIKITNLWVNRLIGDEQPHVAKKYTFTDIKPYTANSPLLPSGLLGPLRIVSITRQ